MIEDDIRDGMSVMNLMRIADEGDRNAFREFLAQMAPYKSAVLWPQMLLDAPKIDNLHYFYAVEGGIRDQNIDVWLFEHIEITRPKVGRVTITDPDELFRLCVKGASTIHFSGGDHPAFSWWELLPDREFRLFFDLADAVRYQRTLE